MGFFKIKLSPEMAGLAASVCQLAGIVGTDLDAMREHIAKDGYCTRSEWQQIMSAAKKLGLENIS